MTYQILWPKARWGDDNQIEQASLGELALGHFVNEFAEVSDDQWRTCDAIVSVFDVPQEYQKKLSNCKIFVTPKVGFDNIDVQAWGKRNIPVCNVPDYGTQEVADHALALFLSLVKGITFHTRQLKDKPSENWRPALNPYGMRISNMVFGIIGMGRIGTATALRAKAFGMDVVFFDPYVGNGTELALGVRRVHSLEELAEASDAISLHLPHNAETHEMINAKFLDQAKKNLILINTARGGLIDLNALAEALKNDQILAAGLDVLPQEPASREHPLIQAWSDDEPWIADRLLITPHSAFYTPESLYDMRFKGGEVALNYLEKGRLENCVNQRFLVSQQR